MYVAANTVFDIGQNNCRLVCSELGTTTPTYGWEETCSPGIQELSNGGQCLGFVNCLKLFQYTARHCANNFWIKLCTDIQTAADTGNVKGMYEGIRKVVGPTVRRTCPIKSATGVTLTGQKAQMD